MNAVPGCSATSFRNFASPATMGAIKTVPIPAWPASSWLKRVNGAGDKQLLGLLLPHLGPAVQLDRRLNVVRDANKIAWDALEGWA